MDELIAFLRYAGVTMRDIFASCYRDTAHSLAELGRWLWDGLDDGATEVLRMIGIDRSSRAQRQAAAALLERGRG